MNWKIYALRTFLILYVIGDVIMMTLAIGGAAIGDSELAITLLDYEGDVPIDIKAPVWSIVVVLVLTIFYLVCVVRLFLALDRLVVSAHRGQLVHLDTALTLRGLGRTLIALWVALLTVELFAPLALFWNEMSEGNAEVSFAPFDLKVVLALIGIALWMVAGLAEEADDMKKELSGVV